jgi:hypothetical protein
LTYSPAYVLRAYLVARHLVSLPEQVAGYTAYNTPVPPLSVLGWPCYVGLLGDQPDRAIALYNTGARGDGRLMAGGVVEHPAVSIMGRALDGEDVVRKLAQIRADLEKAKMVTVVIDSQTSYLLKAVSLRPGVQELEEEPERRRQRAVTNVYLTLEEIIP